MFTANLGGGYGDFPGAPLPPHMHGLPPSNISHQSTPFVATDGPTFPHCNYPSLQFALHILLAFNWGGLFNLCISDSLAFVVCFPYSWGSAVTFKLSAAYAYICCLCVFLFVCFECVSDLCTLVFTHSLKQKRCVPPSDYTSDVPTSGLVPTDYFN